ncbi:MAG: hypothetical protein BWZ01_03117 [Deltaproteobacteria bacterium ADurb.BinA179]|nr:MAG: hypothetical protein BWZ01_03117 [Deltaproteobacteria bacterium ADurb.BinA179]
MRYGRHEVLCPCFAQTPGPGREYVSGRHRAGERPGRPGRAGRRQGGPRLPGGLRRCRGRDHSPSQPPAPPRGDGMRRSGAARAVREAPCRPSRARTGDDPRRPGEKPRPVRQQHPQDVSVVQGGQRGDRFRPAGAACRHRVHRGRCVRLAERDRVLRGPEGLLTGSFAGSGRPRHRHHLLVGRRQAGGRRDAGRLVRGARVGSEDPGEKGRVRDPDNLEQALRAEQRLPGKGREGLHRRQRLRLENNRRHRRLWRPHREKARVHCPELPGFRHPHCRELRRCAPVPGAAPCQRERCAALARVHPRMLWAQKAARPFVGQRHHDRIRWR